eukprot:TRINITY_DN6681_c0_g1_i1.p1 TRINITY_DN6681_c0_g1~~TRINITY_DN6681_c0_g1_i1.p1  ORF type:complete len:761 (-),score=138.66 TRINITY_DN6681_c0_g1_i1:365-2626(-)
MACSSWSAPPASVPEEEDEVEVRESERGPLDFRVCVVDADSVGALAEVPELVGSSPARGFHGPRVRRAVAELQRQGLRVILVSRRDLSELCIPPSAHGDAEDLAINSDNLLHVKALNATVIDVICLAEEYQCCFLTASDIAPLQNDWRLPPRRQAWLKQLKQDLHASFKFDKNGCFEAIFPERVKSFLLSNCVATSHKPARDLPTSEATDMDHPVPPSAPAKQDGGMEDRLDPYSGMWRFDTVYPPLAVWSSGESRLPILCVFCDMPSDAVFQASHQLSNSIVCSEINVFPSQDGPESLKALVRRLGQEADGAWSGHTEFQVARTSSSTNSNGLCAVGLGSKKLSRQRAARLAYLVAEIATRCAEDEVPDIAFSKDPAVDDTVRDLVFRARALIRNVPDPSAGPTSSASYQLLSIDDQPLTLRREDEHQGAAQELANDIATSSPPPIAITQREADITQREGISITGTWHSDGGHPAMAVLHAATTVGPSAHVVCIFCQAESDPVFQNACTSSDSIACEDLRDLQDEACLSAAMAGLEREIGGVWSDYCSSYISCRAVGGRSDGLLAVGVGSRKVARKRAARLALVVAEQVWNVSCSGIMHGNSQLFRNQAGDDVMQELVQRATQLMSAAAAVPSAPSQSSSSSSGGKSKATQQGLVPQPCASAWLEDGGDHNVPKELKGRIMRAKASHVVGPDSGYLSFNTGDQVRLVYNKIEPPGPHDEYSGYVYGELCRSAYKGSGNASGWLPWDLLEFCD